MSWYRDLFQAKQFSPPIGKYIFAKPGDKALYQLTFFQRSYKIILAQTAHGDITPRASQILPIVTYLFINLNCFISLFFKGFYHQLSRYSSLNSSNSLHDVVSLLPSSLNLSCNQCTFALHFLIFKHASPKMNFLCL